MLLRQDASGETSTLDLRASEQDDGYVADGIVLEPDSSWDAAVVVRDAGATEVGRARFAWALDADGVSEGRSTPIVDPALLAGVVLLVAAAIGLTFALAGGLLPLVHPAVGRQALLAGGTLGVALGAVLLLGGPA